jgi:hypothetical protein
MDENLTVSNINPPTDADRIALTSMFKAIAEYGRRVRLRRLAASDSVEPSKGRKAGKAGDAPLEGQQHLQDALKKGND